MIRWFRTIDYCFRFSFYPLTYVNLLYFLDNDDRMLSKRWNLSALVFLINSTTKVNLIHVLINFLFLLSFVSFFFLGSLKAGIQVLMTGRDGDKKEYKYFLFHLHLPLHLFLDQSSEVECYRKVRSTPRSAVCVFHWQFAGACSDSIHRIPKWGLINYSFVCMLISPLRLIWRGEEG